MKKLFFAAALLCANVLAFAAPDVAAPTPTIPANQVKSIYSDAYAPKASWGFLEGWGQSTTLAEQEIDGNHFLLYSNFNYLGWQAATPYSCLNMEKLHLDIWADEAGKIGIVPIYGGNGLTTDDSHRKIVDLEAGKWNSFDLDLATDFAGLDLSSIFQFKYDEGTIATFALDNVFFYTTVAPDEDTEAPKDFTAELVSASYFGAKIKASATDNSGEVTFNVYAEEELVGTANGESGKEVIVAVSDLWPGLEYNLSVVAADGSGNATEPIAVVVNTTEVPDPAPVPTLAAENVVSLFSDVYETATTYETLMQNWWEGPSFMIEGPLAEGDQALYYADFGSDGGCFGWAFKQGVDAAGFQKAHLDIYPTANTSMVLWPVIQPEANYKKTVELEGGKWNTVILDYTDMTFEPFTQFGWVLQKNIEGFFVDNVYFFKEAEEGIEDVNASVKAVKAVKDGQMIIIKNGTRYNVLGSEIK